MQRVIKLFTKRKQSTQRVDNMANIMARAALDKRLNQMLALHATQPLPQREAFAILSNPIQNQAVL